MIRPLLIDTIEIHARAGDECHLLVFLSPLPVVAAFAAGPFVSPLGGAP
jgi:hypothetical protein